MSYYFSKKLHSDLPHAVERVTDALKQNGSGHRHRDRRQKHLKKSLASVFAIIGSSAPAILTMAREALLIEDKIGTMLPCNVVVQELPDGQIEVAAHRPGRVDGGGRQSTAEADGPPSRRHAAQGRRQPLRTLQDVTTMATTTIRSSYPVRIATP